MSIRKLKKDLKSCMQTIEQQKIDIAKLEDKVWMIKNPPIKKGTKVKVDLSLDGGILLIGSRSNSTKTGVVSMYRINSDRGDTAGLGHYVKRYYQYQVIIGHDVKLLHESKVYLLPPE